MIHYTSGDIFSRTTHALVNPVNTVGVMGKGLALAFKKKYPHNFNCYQEACQMKKLDVGQILVVEDQDLFGPRTIVNFPTKRDWKNPSEYAYIESGLRELAAWLDHSRKEIQSIAIPALGCGLGGLEWIKVKKMIELKLAGLTQDIYVYEPL
jgi:O-acetyl-ADP-ribose deacetylase (regulator of RNase III)